MLTDQAYSSTRIRRFYIFDWQLNTRVFARDIEQQQNPLLARTGGEYGVVTRHGALGDAHRITRPVTRFRNNVHPFIGFLRPQRLDEIRWHPCRRLTESDDSHDAARGANRTPVIGFIAKKNEQVA